MSNSVNNSDLTEKERWLAAEFAMGVLEKDEHDQAAILYDQSISFQHEVDGWTSRLTPMLDDVEPQMPSPAVWSQIENRLGLVDTPSTAPKGLAAWWQSVNLWRGLSVGTSAVAAIALAMLIYGGPLAPTQPSLTTQELVATLTSEGTSPAMVARLDRAKRQMTIVTAMQSSAEHDHELWLVPAEGNPISIALVAAEGTATLDLDDALLAQLDEGATFAISVEPLGGSPTGLPTGPVIASGQLRTI
ncbi:anti-sigma factor [Maritalea sp. S77]|uniref:anti-sigma factor n=1 Tax=Maritalea sp. S77 TaxID=3415125 RepID=UPI003C7D14B4